MRGCGTLNNFAKPLFHYPQANSSSSASNSPLEKNKIILNKNIARNEEILEDENYSEDNEIDSSSYLTRLQEVLEAKKKRFNVFY